MSRLHISHPDTQETGPQAMSASSSDNDFATALANIIAACSNNPVSDIADPLYSAKPFSSATTVTFTLDDARAIVDMARVLTPEPTPPRELYEDHDEPTLHLQHPTPYHMDTSASSQSFQPTTATMSPFQSDLENPRRQVPCGSENTGSDADEMDLIYPELEERELTPPTSAGQPESHQLQIGRDNIDTPPLPCHCIGLEHCGVSLDPQARLLGLDIPSIAAPISQETTNIIARWIERHSNCPSSERALSEQQFRYLSQWIIGLLGHDDSSNAQLCVAVLKLLSASSGNAPLSTSTD